MLDQKRCAWCGSDSLYIDYHDKEWGRPIYDDRHLFEMLNLEGAQAGLSWITILKKRENYRKHFANFQAEKLVKFTDSELEQILQDPGIVRNRLKVFSVRQNAEAFLKMQKEFGSFNRYIWSFVDGTPIINAWHNHKQIPAETVLSKALSKDLKQRGFKFVGSTIVYAFMQAVGMVDDHLVDCFCHSSYKG